ncbi:MAG: HEPN domain-containing protein [Cyanobacteria bacterium]|nr:HEPN domain-containing protein [Cyanobacteriota bacterium]
MSQARTGAWWRQAHNDLELAELAGRNGFHAQACFFATQAAEGLDVTALAPLPLPALSRMIVTSRYPLDDTPPSELFDARDSDQALTTAKAVLAWVEQLDQPHG